MRPIPGGQERWEQNPPRRSHSWADAPTGDSPAGHRERRLSAEMLSTAQPCLSPATAAEQVPAAEIQVSLWHLDGSSHYTPKQVL